MQMNNFMQAGENQSAPTADVNTQGEGIVSSAFDDQLQFLIKKGVLDTSTAEFLAFKRQNVTNWGAIS
jgi:hypothetical protein